MVVLPKGLKIINMINLKIYTIETPHFHSYNKELLGYHIRDNNGNILYVGSEVVKHNFKFLDKTAEVLYGNCRGK